MRLTNSNHVLAYDLTDVNLLLDGRNYDAAVVPYELSVFANSPLDTWASLSASRYLGMENAQVLETINPKDSLYIPIYGDNPLGPDSYLVFTVR